MSSRGVQPTRFMNATHRTMQAKAWGEHLDDRRAEVYRTDVEFTGKETRRTRHLSPAEQEELIARLRELRGVRGMTILDCALETGVSMETVRRYIKRGEIDEDQ